MTCNETEHRWVPDEDPHWMLCRNCGTREFVAPGHLLRWIQAHRS